MPRKPKEPPILLKHFIWRLFRRAGVFYAVGRNVNHNLGKHSLGTRDPAEALQRLQRLDQRKAEELGLTEPLPPPASGITSIADGWQRYLDFSGRSEVLGGVSAGSLQRYRAVRDKHKAYCAEQGLATWNAFGKIELEKYGNLLSKKYAYRTVYFELTLLKSVNAWLIENDHLPPDCKLHYPLRKAQGTDTYCYTTPEVAAIVKHCSERPEHVWLAQVVLVLAQTGLRISELADLRWADVDLTAGVLRIADERSNRRKAKAGTARTTKGRRSRLIPIHHRLHKLLTGLKRLPDGRVLHAERGGRLRPRNVLAAFIRDAIEPLQDQFQTPEDDIGFEHGRLHSFRHYFCSQAFIGGAGEGEVREWLGHADSKMVEHYRHLRQEDAIRRMEQINFLPDEEPQSTDKKA